MFTIYMILQIFAASKEISIIPNEFNIIDTFQNFGIILGANITYLSENSHQCDIIKQKLINSQINEILLVPNAKEHFFESQFINGSLKEQINYNYILSMVPIQIETVVAVILFSNGNLAYIKEDNNNFIFVDSNYSISIDQTQLKIPVYMFYLSKTKQILIILHKELIKISINFNKSNIFESSLKQDDSRFLTTQNILFVENLLFIAGGQELAIYSIDLETFEKVDNSNLTMNFIDIKVFFENGIYKVFSLHRKQGVKIFTYDPNLQVFNQTSPLHRIPQQGYILGVYYNILIIVDDEQNQSIVYEFHYSQKDDLWNFFNLYKSQKKIKDIEFTEHYAILIGSNGHEIIYHSLPTEDYEMKNQVIIPGLESIYFLNKTGNYNQSLIGITKYTFFASQFYLSPQKIRCHNINTSTPMRFIYYQNSTQCSKLLQKEERKICLFIQNYTVNYIHTIISSKYKIQFEIILGVSLIIFIILLIIKKSRKNIKNTFHIEAAQQPDIQRHQSSIGTPMINEKQSLFSNQNQESNINEKSDSNINEKSDSNINEKSDSNINEKSESNINEKSNLNNESNQQLISNGSSLFQQEIEEKQNILHQSIKIDQNPS
ncbi:unnamed protein product [Paramecium sonneborni]|uniref:Transmembrane protein n=1 Tax=Paramecium sonneborni TaxID=65129 RepID=A0A8S1NYZ3_9CILI|nr:unnamed protein product [Paramecium sonneborni]